MRQRVMADCRKLLLAGSRSKLLIGVAIFGALLATAVTARLLLAHNLTWQCPMLQLTGLPCPFCGTTRTFAALSELRIGQALALNPLAVLAIPAAVLFPLWLRRTETRWFPIGCGALLFLNWIYLIFFLPR